MLHALKDEEASYFQIICSIRGLCSDFGHQEGLSSLRRQWWEQLAGRHLVASHWHKHYTGQHISFHLSYSFFRKREKKETALAYRQSSGDLLRILNDACQVPSTRELSKAAYEITGREEEILYLLALCLLTLLAKIPAKSDCLTPLQLLSEILFS